MWSEIKKILIPNKNKHSRTTCDISANDFNQHFSNIGNKMNSKFQHLSDNLSWKGSKSNNTFCFTKVSSRDVEKYVSSRTHIFLKHSHVSQINPSSRGCSSKPGKMLESRMFIKMMVTSMTKLPSSIGYWAYTQDGGKSRELSNHRLLESQFYFNGQVYLFKKAFNTNLSLSCNRRLAWTYKWWWNNDRLSARHFCMLRFDQSHTSLALI